MIPNGKSRRTLLQRQISNSTTTTTWCGFIRFRNAFQYFIALAGVWLLILMQSHRVVVDVQSNVSHKEYVHHENAPVLHINMPSSRHVIDDFNAKKKEEKKEAGIVSVAMGNRTEKSSDPPNASTFAEKSPAWDEMLLRAQGKRNICQQDDKSFIGFDKRYQQLFGADNQTLATLPAFGIIEALEKFDFHAVDPKWQCQMPPENECAETQLTVVFMAYNPDRLGVTFSEIRKLLSRDAFQNLVKECVLVWNGPRAVDESQEGRQLLEFAKTNPLRVEYPLKMGFPNDLMNRYHPDVVKISTKAILYYDDDGPFYSYKAIESGFELWKRHARAQIGAMSRQINYSPRQLKERRDMDAEPNDRLFVTHCDNLHDKVEYNYFYFANYDANMVLPSGSMLHSNYLCFLWHPAFDEIRQFVLAHPVHPDDITVSTIVSHLAGRAPRVYSRRLNKQDPAMNAALGFPTKKAGRRRLDEKDSDDEEEMEEKKDEEILAIAVDESSKPKGAGIGGICWDCGSGMTEKKKIWADLRSQAINTLIRYFGSINSGSIGWCAGTQFYMPNKSDGKCKPIMARQGWLPWMADDGTPKATCP